MTGTRPKTIATICARGASRGLPRKNVRLFAGKPLIAHSIEQALACPLIEGVFVSTEDDEIAEIARRYGAEVPYRRPAELATDAAAKLPVIEHLVGHLERQGLAIGCVVDLQPTSPLRSAQDIVSAIGLRELAELVVTVTEPSHNPYYSLAELDAQGFLRPCKPGAAARRQEAPAVWGLNGSIYVWQRPALSKAAAQGFWSVSIKCAVMPRHRSVDIDSELDFEWAEWLHARMRENRS